MAQIFDRSSNALARMSLVLTGLIVIALGVTLDGLQRSPWVTRQGSGRTSRCRSAKAPCAGTGAAMPVLSRTGREVELRGHTADQDLYQLPLAKSGPTPPCWSLSARAGLPANRWFGPKCMTFRLRLFQSLHPCEQRAWDAPAVMAAWT